MQPRLKANQRTVLIAAAAGRSHAARKIGNELLVTTHTLEVELATIAQLVTEAFLLRTFSN